MKILGHPIHAWFILLAAVGVLSWILTLVTDAWRDSANVWVQIGGWVFLLTPGVLGLLAIVYAIIDTVNNRE